MNIKSSPLGGSPFSRARVSLALFLATMLLGGSFAVSQRAAAQSLSNGRGNLRVMTYNMYAGTSYVEALRATNFPELLAAVTTTLNNVRASNPPERAAAVAREIGKAQPDLISIQEAAQWVTCPTVNFQSCSALPTLEFDLLQLLMQALEQQGQHYKIVVATTTFTLAAPSSGGLLVQATDRLAVLARTDLNPNQFQISNVQTASYFATFTPTVTGIPFPVHRAWASVDVTFHDGSMRFIATHLESAHPSFTDAQAAELIAGPANTSLPVVIAMDSNTNPDQPADPTSATYQKFLTSGFTDAWTAANPFDAGFTWGDYSTQPISLFIATVRNDLILVRGGIGVKAADLFGADPASRTPHGLWPSDHLGVGARLELHAEKAEN
jgi:endonuclease/exonuclease/phosphatase family metal-dependent hydrolase